MLYVLGDQAEDIVLSRNNTEDTHNNVLEAFDTYFELRKNLIAERAKFNRLSQGSDSVDVFINKLHRQAEYCDYKALKQELIRDRLVVGVQDDELSEKLQAMPDLTLDVATLTVRQYEAAKQAQTIVRGNRSGEVDSIRRQTKYQSDKRQHSASMVAKSENNNSYSSSNECARCGSRPRHSRSKYPAISNNCLK